MVPHRRNGSLSSPEVNSGAIRFRVNWFSHHEEMFGMVSRYVVSMVDTWRPRTLSTRDINIEVPISLAGIAYLIIKSEVYGFIG